jgi:hypothetical protein
MPTSDQQGGLSVPDAEYGQRIAEQVKGGRTLASSPQAAAFGAELAHEDARWRRGTD